MSTRESVLVDKRYLAARPDELSVEQGEFICSSVIFCAQVTLLRLSTPRNLSLYPDFYQDTFYFPHMGAGGLTLLLSGDLVHVIRRTGEWIEGEMYALMRLE